MSIIKDSNAANSLLLGMTLADAREIVENEGFMFGYLPKCFQTDELKEIAEQWWINNFMQKYDHYRNHPQEVTAILAQAQVAGRQVVVGNDMKFDVSLEEMD